MLDITKLLERQEAKEDKVTKLVKGVKERGNCELVLRKKLRDLQGFNRCCPTERKKLKQKFESNNIVVIGDLTLNQDDYVHLIYKYSPLYKNIKFHFESKMK